ncbi:MAG: ABC transporter substrate-binding protein [Anaerolineae bacterium]
MRKLRLLFLVVLVMSLLVSCAQLETTPGAPGVGETPGELPETGETLPVETPSPLIDETTTPSVDETPTSMIEEETPTVEETEMVEGTPTTEETPMEEATPPLEATVVVTATAEITPVAGLRTPQEAALEAAEGEEIGGTVTVLGVWGGSELDSFMAMLQPFQEATGIEVEFTGTRDLNAVLTTRIQGGNPPDVAGLPGPGQMAEYARAGHLVDLTDVLEMDTYQDQYAETWIDLGTVDDQLVGVFIKAAVKGLIWYNPAVWDEAGYEIPATWQEMMTLSQQIADSGTTPWSVALESGAASGWPGTDWLEDIVLRQAGPDVYNQWWAGEIAWTSDEIRQAWETWGEIVADPNMVFGGSNTMLTTNFGQVGDPLFTDPPNAYMAHQASFITDFFVENNPDVEPGVDFDFFPFPTFEEGGEQRTVIAGDLFGMFNDTPQARALMRYLVTPEAQAIWVQRGGAISPNTDVPLEEYPDDLSQAAADLLTTAETVAFDASDLMPEAMNNAFWQGILEYVQSPESLDDVLQNLDDVQEGAYEQ